MNKPCTDTEWDNWVQQTYTAPNLNHLHVYGMINVMRWQKDGSTAPGATAESITDDEWRLITPPDTP